MHFNISSVFADELSVFDNFVGLVLKGLKPFTKILVGELTLFSVLRIIKITKDRYCNVRTFLNSQNKF